MNFDYSTVPESRLDPIWESAYTTRTGLKHGYLCAKYVSDHKIPGVIVECGVANGAQVGMMARAMDDAGDQRAFHLFDSFDGIPLAGPHDADQPGIGKPRHDVNAPLCERLKSSGISIGKLENVRANVAKWSKWQSFTFHKGWFQDTLPALKDFPPIALLRLDGDLYESTAVCMQYLYPLVVDGGLIVIDDYGLPGCALAVDEYREYHGITSPLTVENVGYNLATWIK